MAQPDLYHSNTPLFVSFPRQPLPPQPLPCQPVPRLRQTLRVADLQPPTAVDVEGRDVGSFGPRPEVRVQDVEGRGLAERPPGYQAPDPAPVAPAQTCCVDAPADRLFWGVSALLRVERFLRR